MEYKDYYKTLGVDKNASAEEIKKQYRILARKYHPDVSKENNAEEKFKEVREAYEVLKDPAKKKAYDQMGSQWQAGQRFTPPPEWDFRQAQVDTGQFDVNGFSEFFENLFGRRAGHARGGRYEYAERGQDLHSKINLSLEEAFSGTERVIQLQEPEVNSHGQIALKTRSLKVKIPPGVVEGQQIRLSGQGGKGLGQGANGNLYLEIHLNDHPLYTVKDRDIYVNLPVAPWEAALGAKVAAPTLGGKVEMTIPPNSQSGTKLRLKGRGLPAKSPGDEYVVLKIVIPEPKTDAERQLYKKMAEEMHFDPRRGL
ncbi:MAG TPA: DnaJ C-terminal domain-containing protein [Gammaproteobacteria bacterium]|nr:DnaJ C-terminal domain-containing protein [Gammaproteobacteria bacterium]